MVQTCLCSPLCTALVTRATLLQILLATRRRALSRAVQLGDKDAHELWSSSANECRPFKDPSYDLRRAVRDSGVQAAAGVSDAAVQVRMPELLAAASAAPLSLQLLPWKRSLCWSADVLIMLVAVGDWRQGAPWCGAVPASGHERSGAAAAPGQQPLPRVPTEH
jgi:hypothetical protein